MAERARQQAADDAGPRRRWALRLLTAITFPLLLLLLAEGGLRLAGIGYPASLFLVEREAETLFLRQNPDVTRPWFATGLERRPWPLRLPAEKSKDTYRIFILGGSAAMGDPDPSFSMARQLAVLLENRIPEQRFEVVNAAITAINSHLVREIAADCARQAPDLFVVYMGNNEVVGPYGPGTAFGGYLPTRGPIRLSSFARQLRLSQVLRSIKETLLPAGEWPAWRGLAMFLDNPVPAGDPRLAGVYANFEGNLRDIVRTGKEAGASVLLCSVGTGLRSTPPFLSVHAPAIDANVPERWSSLHADAVRAQRRGEWHKAREGLRQALEIDPAYAETHYRLARCLDMVDRHEEARLAYERARDLDALRVRADSSINASIRRLAAESAGADVFFADAERALHTAGVDGIADDSVFFDHVHLTFYGTYVVSRLLLEAVEQDLATRALARTAHNKQPVLTLEQCAAACAYTSWDIFRLMHILYGRFLLPPYTHQADHELRMAAFRERIDALQSYVAPEALAEARKVYEEALRKRPGDWVLHRNYGRLLAEAGRAAEALEELATAYALLPAFLPARSYGEALVRNGKIDEALRLLRELPDRNSREKALLLNSWGAGLLTEGRNREARTIFEAALELHALPILHSNLGLCLARLGERDAALAYLEEALQQAPDDPQLHFNHAVVREGRGDLTAARESYQRALELDPGYVDAAYHRARLDLALGDAAAAEKTLLELVHLRPRLLDAHLLLGDVYAVLGQPESAGRHLREALLLAPRLPLALEKLARFYRDTGHPADAIRHYETLAAVQAEHGARAEAAGSLSRALALAEEAGLTNTLPTIRRQLAEMEGAP